MPIKSEELRRGNILQLNRSVMLPSGRPGWCWFVVCEILTDHVQGCLVKDDMHALRIALSDFRQILCADLAPIPLSFLTLRACGFNFAAFGAPGETYARANVFITHEHGRWRCGRYTIPGTLHHLQNLFFDLTGEELDLTHELPG